MSDVVVILKKTDLFFVLLGVLVSLCVLAAVVFYGFGV